MKKLMAVMAVVVAFAFGAPLVAEAEQCPLLIKQLTERLAKLPDHSFKKEIGQRAAVAAQKLHDEGKHADSVRMVEEAVAVSFGH